MTVEDPTIFAARILDFLIRCGWDATLVAESSPLLLAEWLRDYGESEAAENFRFAEYQWGSAEHLIGCNRYYELRRLVTRLHEYEAPLGADFNSRDHYTETEQ